MIVRDLTAHWNDVDGNIEVGTMYFDKDVNVATRGTLYKGSIRKMPKPLFEREVVCFYITLFGRLYISIV